MADVSVEAAMRGEPSGLGEQRGFEYMSGKAYGGVLREGGDVKGMLNGVSKGKERELVGGERDVRRGEKDGPRNEEMNLGDAKDDHTENGDNVDGSYKVSDHVGLVADGVNGARGEPSADDTEERPESEHDMEEIPDEHPTASGTINHHAHEDTSRSYADVAAEHMPAGGPSVDMRSGLFDEDEGIQVEEENEDNEDNEEQPGPSNETEHVNEAVQEEPADKKGLKEDGIKKLTTVKRSGDERKSEKDKPKRDERSKLVSGRQAGAGWRRSSVRFAPLNVPLQRRLQTGMVLFHTLTIPLFLTLFWFLCAIPLTWPLLVPYLIYLLLSNASTSGTLSHRWNGLRRSKIWSLYASYFPARLHRSEILPPTRKYIFGYHPHGIISHGAFASFATEALGFSQLFPGITNTLLTLDSNFRIPIYRDYVLAMGAASVSRTSCENILSKGGPNGEGMGRAITIVIGGAAESLDAQPGTMRLVLKKRKGFVKLAIRTGADLVPVLAFGENELYEQLIPDQHSWIYRWQMGAKKVLGFTIPLFHARGVFNYDVGLLPYRRPVNVVVGRPIRVEQQRAPEQGYLDEVHAEYMRELERLWAEWRGEFMGGSEAELEILE